MIGWKRGIFIARHLMVDTICHYGIVFNIVILASSLNERMILIGIGENVIVWW